jgi:hypothetical protein
VTPVCLVRPSGALIRTPHEPIGQLRPFPSKSIRSSRAGPRPPAPGRPCFTLNAHPAGVAVAMMVPTSSKKPGLLGQSRRGAAPLSVDLCLQRFPISHGVASGKGADDLNDTKEDRPDPEQDHNPSEGAPGVPNDQEGDHH